MYKTMHKNVYFECIPSTTIMFGVEGYHIYYTTQYYKLDIYSFIYSINIYIV